MTRCEENAKEIILIHPVDRWARAFNRSVMESFGVEQVAFRDALVVVPVASFPRYSNWLREQGLSWRFLPSALIDRAVLNEDADPMTLINQILYNPEEPYSWENREQTRWVPDAEGIEHAVDREQRLTPDLVVPASGEGGPQPGPNFMEAREKVSPGTTCACFFPPNPLEPGSGCNNHDAGRCSNPATTQGKDTGIPDYIGSRVPLCNSCRKEYGESASTRDGINDEVEDGVDRSVRDLNALEFDMHDPRKMDQPRGESTTISVEQINGVFVKLLGHEARQADIQVIQMLGGTCEVAAEYIWDHWMGEPESPTPEDILKMMEISEDVEGVPGEEKCPECHHYWSEHENQTAYMRRPGILARSANPDEKKYTCQECPGGCNGGWTVEDVEDSHGGEDYFAPFDPEDQRIGDNCSLCNVRPAIGFITNADPGEEVSVCGTCADKELGDSRWGVGEAQDPLEGPEAFEKGPRCICGHSTNIHDRGTDGCNWESEGGKPCSCHQYTEPAGMYAPIGVGEAVEDRGEEIGRDGCECDCDACPANSHRATNADCVNISNRQIGSRIYCNQCRPCSRCRTSAYNCVKEAASSVRKKKKAKVKKTKSGKKRLADEDPDNDSSSSSSSSNSSSDVAKVLGFENDDTTDETDAGQETSKAGTRSTAPDFNPCPGYWNGWCRLDGRVCLYNIKTYTECPKYTAVKSAPAELLKIRPGEEDNENVGGGPLGNA